MAMREWIRISLAFSSAWLVCAALSTWSLHAALGAGTVRSTVAVSLRMVVITQATPWVLAAVLTPAVIWYLGRVTTSAPGARVWAIAAGGITFLILHNTTLPVLAVLFDRGEWTWPRWDGPMGIKEATGAVREPLCFCAAGITHEHA